MNKSLNMKYAISAIILAIGIVAYFSFSGNASPLEDNNDLIKVSLEENQTISSSETINGSARGYYFFEANFGVELYDGNENLVGTFIAKTDEEWMTEEFIDFYVDLDFNKPNTTNGSLHFIKANASGLPENDYKFIVPVTF